MPPSNTLNAGLSPALSSPGMSMGWVPAPVSWDTGVTWWGGWEGDRGLGWARGSVLRALLGTCWGRWASPACLGERSVCSGTSSGAGRVSACKGVAVVLADPPANPGSGLGVSPAPARRWQAARRGFWDVLLGSPGSSQGQGRSCRALKPSAYGKAGEQHCSQLWRRGVTPARLVGLSPPVQTYPSACSGFFQAAKGLPKSLSTPCWLSFGQAVGLPKPPGAQQGRRRAVAKTTRVPATWKGNGLRRL